MPNPGPTSVRNIGIFAHIDAGKTSLTERILFLSGRLRNPGTVDAGTTATDYLKVERERGITVKAACVRLDWRGASINLIDTPGHVDFGGEVERSMRVLDGAVVALCAVAGVQSRTEGILRNSARRGLPRLAFINKMDRKGASFERAYGELAAFDSAAIPIQVPWGEGPEFRGVLDLVSMTLTVFQGSDASAMDGGPPGPAAKGQGGSSLPPDLLEAAELARARLVEALAECDEAMMAAYAEGRPVTADELSASLRAACVSGSLIPVLCGSAFVDPSVALLLDAVRDYLPNPEEAGCPEGQDPRSGETVVRESSPDAAFSSFVFKTQADPNFGRLSWLRIWSGRLSSGDKVSEAGTGASLRVQRIFSIQADSLEDLQQAQAGDIIAISWGSSGQSRPSGGPSVPRAAPGSTGSSLCSPSAPILYEALDLAEPVVSLALEALTRADGEALAHALSLLLEEDPSLQAKEDRDTGRVTLSGMGELHLEVAVERLRTEQGVRLRVGRPQVSCREALDRASDAACDFDRDMNGERVKAQVGLVLRPRPRGSGRLSVAGPGLKLPAPLLAAFTRGVDAALSVGPSGGWPVDDVEAVLLTYSLPSSRQAELVLEIASSIAAHSALVSAGTTSLEPWMRVEITAAEACLGPAVAAISGRGGRVESIEDEAGEKLITAAAPLRLLFGFETELRSATAGRASHQAKFLRYEAERPTRG